MLRAMLLAISTLVVAANCARAQEFPQPGAEHQELQKLAGTWDAVMDMAGQKSQARATYKPICGGMWMASDFEGSIGGQKFQGHGLDGYDLRQKKYVAIWVDSIESAPMHLEGDYDQGTRLLVMTGESVGQDGNPQAVKTTTEFKDEDHFIFKMYMVQPDGTEQLAFSITYSRRK